MFWLQEVKLFLKQLQSIKVSCLKENCYMKMIQKLFSYCLQPLFLKMWRDSTKHHYSPDVCNVLAYISVLEIWLLVQVLSGEAPLRVKVYFQCAYLYGACLNRKAKWSKIFPAIRPGNQGLWWIKIPFSVWDVNISHHWNSSQNQYKQCNITCFIWKRMMDKKLCNNQNPGLASGCKWYCKEWCIHL